MKFFRNPPKMIEFQLSEQLKFDMMVGIETIERSQSLRFGVDMKKLDEFIQDLLQVEIEGRKFRTEYKINMDTASPQAENFLWTILGNKVRQSSKTRQ